MLQKSCSPPDMSEKGDAEQRRTKKPFQANDAWHPKDDSLLVSWPILSPESAGNWGIGRDFLFGFALDV